MLIKKNKGGLLFTCGIFSVPLTLKIYIYSDLSNNKELAGFGGNFTIFVAKGAQYIYFS